MYRRLQYFLSPQLDIYQYVVPHLHVKDKVLDIGCGTGFGTLQLTRESAYVTGVDIDQDAIRFANKCLPGVEFEWADITRPITHIGRDYDVVLMIEVLEHVEEWQLALRNAIEVMRNDGRLIISARNTNADLRKNDLHEREWSAEQFDGALRKFFESVILFDYKLKHVQEISTRQTPLVAIARKPRR
jgi:2-polyprenyl-3-methyl-5-hydroxy-6-metoxy-1,4-benzoquinol methylase